MLVNILLTTIKHFLPVQLKSNDDELHLILLMRSLA